MAPAVAHRLGLRTVGLDGVSTDPFEPWSADGWEWELFGQPVANPQVCR